MQNNKKQILIGIFTGILLSFLTLLILTTSLPQIKAQQTQQKYTVFKTQNEGFKFLKFNISHYKIIEDTNKPTLQYATTVTRLPCDKNSDDINCPNSYQWSNAPSNIQVAYDIDGGCNYWGTCHKSFRAYTRQQTNIFERTPSLDFGYDYNSGKKYFYYPGKTPITDELYDRSADAFETINTITSSSIPSGKYDLRLSSSSNLYTLEAKPIKSEPVYTLILAPLFAQTPTESSPPEQVATKEYVDSVFKLEIRKLTQYKRRTINGLICANEYGVYIYKQEGSIGQIWFTSVTGRKTAIHIDLDNSNGGNWYKFIDCGSWGCVTDYWILSYLNERAFKIAEWNWNDIGSKDVYIEASGLSRVTIAYNQPPVYYSLVFWTGRKFLGNNYGCNRNWSISIWLPFRDSNEPNFRSVVLPNNLTITDRRVGEAIEYIKYIGNSPIMYAVENLDTTKTSIPLDMNLITQICGDIDGCEISYYDQLSNPNLAAGSNFKYFPETKKWVRGNPDGTRARGTDGNNSVEHIANWDPIYFTDGEYLNGQLIGDAPGLNFLYYSTDSNRKPILIFRD